MEHKLHIYTGEGKGKTTAAMGLALRALGHGLSVLVAQFIKDGRSGELAALQQLAQVTVWNSTPLQGFVSRMSEHEQRQAYAAQTAQAIALIAEIEAHKPQLIVLDELGLALHMSMVDEQVALSLVDAALASGETVVTGRYVPDWLQQKADYLSTITAKKHPYETEGLNAREGVEW